MTSNLQTASNISSPQLEDVSLNQSNRSGDGARGAAFRDEYDTSDDEQPTSSQPLHSRISTQAHRPSFVDEDEELTASAAAAARKAQDQADKNLPVTWHSLPKKGQLAVLTLARLSEPLAERSLSAYMFYQLKSFDPSLPDSTIASQGGMLTASFAAAQFLTAVWWGRAADTPWIGRKRVLLVGLAGTGVSCLGVGFSRTFGAALVWRVLAGALNGNVGVLRTMISEIIEEKKFQSRAFLLLPMCFNIGVIIGPIFGGFLADPITSFPGIFGDSSLLGGKSGIGWMKKWPYGLPNLVSAGFILSSALLVVLGLDETHPALKHRPDYGRKLGKWLARLIPRRKSSYRYMQIDNEADPDSTAIDMEEHPRASHPQPSTASVFLHTKPSDSSSSTPKPKPKIFTRNVILTLMTHFLLALHISAFNALLFILLPTPRAGPKSPPTHLPLHFTGGLNLPSAKVGLATAIIGVLGLPLQILLYPKLQGKLGTLRAYRWFLPFSPVAYALLPYLTLLPNKTFILWPSLTVILALQVLSRTFALPSMTILVNNSAPDQSVLGTVHGFAQSVSSGARTLGPVVGGWFLGWGLRTNTVGAVWWAMAGVAACNWALLWWLREGEGFGK